MTATPEPTRRDTDQRRLEIAAAARALIAERGFEGLRTRDIAERVGINIATLHYHVPSKEALVELVAQSLRDEFKATDYAVRDLRVNFSRLGDTAWYSCMLDDHAEWKGQPTGWDNARWTGTLEKRDGKWVIVQMHFSFAKDD